MRLLLGLDKDASFGEVWQNVERLEPRPVTNTGRLVIAAAAAALIVVGYVIGRYDTALIALMLGAGRHDAAAGLPPRPGEEGARQPADAVLAPPQTGDGDCPRLSA